MTRLIDANALIEEWYRINDIDENDRGARFVGYTEIARLIDNAPTVDVVSREKYEASKKARVILAEFADDLLAELKERVEVVRCKDCKWIRKAGTLMGENPEPIYGCHHTGVYVFEDGYCDVGERKDEEQKHRNFE